MKRDGKSSILTLRTLAHRTIVSVVMAAYKSRRKQTLERLNVLLGMLSFSTLLLLGCQQSISTRMLRHVVRIFTFGGSVSPVHASHDATSPVFPFNPL